jgi:hypothetical protein
VIKVYTVDLSDSWVDPAVTAMIGHRRGRNQAPVYIAAPTKATAHRLANELPNHWVGYPTLGRLHPAMGDTLDVLVAAGLLNEPGILVTANDGGRSRVVRVTADGPTLIGHLVPQGATGRKVFEAVGTVHTTLSPAAVAALRTLLARVPASDDRQELLDRLPAELVAEHGPT